MTLFPYKLDTRFHGIKTDGALYKDFDFKTFAPVQGDRYQEFIRGGEVLYVNDEFDDIYVRNCCVSLSLFLQDFIVNNWSWSVTIMFWNPATQTWVEKYF